MAFEELINKPMSEEQLLAAVTRVIQANFEGLSDSYFFMKLERSENDLTQIVWIKSFVDVYELGDFYYDTKYERANIMIKAIEDHFELMCHGFRLFDRYKIYRDTIIDSRPIFWGGDIDYSRRPMISRELLNNAFGEIKEELNSSKRNKAV
ncbi:MAG: hypothetical protein KDD38_03110 [Bdellovibrionales bacterium]|nr:hypothetical protein [Bdellovibrionales bacterium]